MYAHMQLITHIHGDMNMCRYLRIMHINEPLQTASEPLVRVHRPNLRLRDTEEVPIELVDALGFFRK